MPKFNYKAKKGLNETVSGSLEADNHDEALNKVTAQGLFPIEVNEVAAPAAKASGKSRRKKKISKKISSKEVLTFTQKMTTLVRAKVELLASLKILYEQTENSRFKEVILEIYNLTKEGKAFSEGLMRFPRIFPPLYVSIVKAGEVSGRLDFSLERICNYLEQQQDMKRKVVSSLAYPIMMVLVGIGSIIVLFTFVIPRLSALFSDLGQNMPLITRVIFFIADQFSRPPLWWSVAVVVASFSLYQRFTRRKLSWKKVLKSAPFLKNIFLLEAIINFSYTLSLMLRSNVPLLTALGISGTTLQDEKLNQQVRALRDDITRGGSLADSMYRLKSFPKILVRMMTIGEESGLLGEVMDSTNQILAKELDARLKVLSSLIEPIIIFSVGLVLGIIVIALLLPILQLSTVSM